MLPLERMRYPVMASPDRLAASAARAIGSAGERLVHTEEVTGSIPVSPTEKPQVRDSAYKIKL